MKLPRMVQMNKEIFEALLPSAVTDIIQKIIDKKNIVQDEAISLFYNSRLYALLEDEQTKIWHCSTDKLLELFDEEMNTGNFELPECW